MKISIAQTSIDIHVYCPYCGNWMNVNEDLREYLEDDLTASGLDVEIECDSISCKKMFIVEEVEY